MKLHKFMEIDTCPICGNELYPSENGFIGKPLEEIPATAIFEIPCTDDTGSNLACGLFRIQRRDQSSEANDWVCEYLLNPRRDTEDF